MPYSSSFSTHHDPGTAIAEAIGHVLEKLGPQPDIAVLFISGTFSRHTSDFLNATTELLAPKALIGCTTNSLISGGMEIEQQTAVALFAGNLKGSATPVRVDAAGIELKTVDGNNPVTSDSHSLILLADPFSFQGDSAVSTWNEKYPQIQVIGGLCSAGTTPGSNHLFLNKVSYSNGAVGLLIEGPTPIEPLVSQGCRPIGSPLIVTNSKENIIFELAGQSALSRLETMLKDLPKDDSDLARSGLHIGRVIDEHGLDFGRGDFLIRAVVGADRGSGAIAIGDVAPVGSTVQFQVRDALSASEDLESMLNNISPGDGALLFTCNGRGRHLFEMPDHDAARVSSAVRGQAVSGMFCAGEIGPVGSRSFLHGFTASVAIFRD